MTATINPGRTIAAARGDLAVLGRSMVLLPAGVVAGFGLLAGLAALAGAEQDRILRLLSALPEVGLSLSAGICAATAVLADPSVELQLSLPTRFAHTVVRRMGVVFAIHAVLAGLSTALLQAAGWWTPPLGVAGAQLAWLAPTAWLAAVGAVVAVLTGSRSATAGMLGTWWLVQNVLVATFGSYEWARPLLLFVTAYAPEADFWLANRGWLLAQAGLLLVVAGVLLRRPETLLAREE